MISFKAAWMSAPSSIPYVSLCARVCSQVLHTNLIKLNSIVLRAKLVQKSLGSLAVRAIRLAEECCVQLVHVAGAADAWDTAYRLGSPQ